MKAISRFATFAVTLCLFGTAETKASDMAVYPMTLTDGVIGGPGADAIAADLESVQFILIGEDHGFADPPEIALALAKIARPAGFVHHAVETGPLSEEWAGSILKAGDADDLSAALAGRPLAMPFLSMREDAQLADYFVDAAGRRRDALWGLDQEFIGAPLILFEDLAGRARTDAARSLIEAKRDAETKAFATGDQGAVFLMSAKPADFSALRAAFAGDRRAEEIIRALEESASIYQAYARGDNYASNADRIALMRREFLKAYRSARGAPPRALFKFGAIHLGRGTTFLNTFDLGSLTEGVAADNGLRVLRIAVLPLEGRQMATQPSPDGFFKEVDFHSDLVEAILLATGVAPSSLPTEGYAVLPLEALRRKLEQKGLSALTPEARFFVLGYDFLVTTRSARPATPLAK